MIDLTKAGLTKNESKVYLALIDHGPNLAGVISRKSGLHRRVVYDTTEMLIQKGLIGYILKNNRRLFSAVNPNKFLEIIDQQKAEVKPFVDELLLKFSLQKDKDETNFFKGKEGLKSVFEDQLLHKEILILGANSKAYDNFKYYFHWFDKKRIEKKVKVRMLTSDKKLKNIPLSTIKYISEISQPLAINMYGDKTAIIMWSEEPIAIVIKQKAITDGYREYFEILWKGAKD